MLFTIAAALTLGPALLTVGSLFGLFDPRRLVTAHLCRRIGASEMLMVESDHDMRNSADFISLDRVAKSLIRLPGVAMVQSITRPLGRPLEHATLPYLFTTQGSGSGQQLPFAEQQNANTDKQAQIEADSVTILNKVIDLTQKMSDELHATVLTMEDLQQVTDQMNSEIANLDDFLRPLKNYFYWEPHCFDIPLCWAFRSLFDALDGIDSLDAQIANAVTSLEAIDRLLPQMITQLKIMTDQTEALQAVLVNSYGPSHLQSAQTDQTFDDMINVGNDFDQSRSDDFFYIPREAFDNEDVKTGMTLMMSPDGKAARFIVTHEGNAMGPEGIEHVDAFPEAIKSALKETSLAGSRIYIGGAASNNKDIKEYAASDLLIVAIAAFVLIFLIMLFITRSLMAALVIPGTVAFSFAGAFGLSVLVWQHLIGLHLHWLVLPITFIILVAVGSDYNLLLIARVKEETKAGLNTGLIRALGSTGGVVTSAGLVFAFTMLAMLTSDLRTIGQVGSTVCIGLLLDTLIVRSFVVPCILRILGPWFWWPTLVRSRPLRAAMRGVT
jgi:transport protein